MRYPIRSEELLEFADFLAGREVDPDHAPTIHLRRAVSSAYYALFHGLIAQATQRTMGAGNDREADRYSVSRWYAHREIRAVCQWVVNRSAGRTVPDGVAALLDTPPPDLVAVAELFLALQQARHAADYDHMVELTLADTRAHVDTARDALGRLPRLSGDRVYDNYLMLLLGGPKIASR
jgi:hypothetical protein